MDKEKYFKKLKTLNQYKNLSEEELYKVVDKKINDDTLIESFVGLKDDEIDKALDLYHRYLAESSFESLAEKTTLIGMIYKEILKSRIQLFIKKESAEKNDAIPLQMAEKLMDLDTQILSDKDKLGMLKAKDNDSFLVTWNELKKKALNYYSEHAGCTTIKCPNCQSLFNLLMDVSNLTAEKCSFFRGTMLYNLPLLNLYHQKRLTKEEVANILGVHENYVLYIYNEIYLKDLEKSDKIIKKEL